MPSFDCSNAFITFSGVSLVVFFAEYNATLNVLSVFLQIRMWSTILAISSAIFTVVSFPRFMSQTQATSDQTNLRRTKGLYCDPICKVGKGLRLHDSRMEKGLRLHDSRMEKGLRLHDSRMDNGRIWVRPKSKSVNSLDNSRTKSTNGITDTANSTNAFNTTNTNLKYDV